MCYSTKRGTNVPDKTVETAIQFPYLHKKKLAAKGYQLVEEGGFEPPKRDATDLQSAPFGHSGTPPYKSLIHCGAGGRTRTPDLLITNQLLYQLSYTSISARPQRSLV